MKRLLTLLLALIMTVSLAACGAAPAEKTEEPEKQEEPSEQEKPLTGEELRVFGMENGIVTGENPEYLKNVKFSGYLQKTEDFYIRDPFILFCDGVYFMYGSNLTSPKVGWQGFSCYASLDLEKWSGPYDVTYGGVDWSGMEYFWAPEVYYYNDSFYMLVTYRHKNAEIGCATLKADNPLGPFKMVSDGYFICDKWSIDASLYVDPDGQPWCLYAYDDKVITASKFSDDLSRLVSEPVPLFDATAVPWTVNSVCEGPFIYTMEDTGTLVMQWAGSNKHGYLVGSATAKSVEGPWTVQQTPLWDATNNSAYEDGGHSMCFRDRYGNLIMAFHSPNKVEYEHGIIEHAKFVPIEEDKENDCLKLVEPVS